MFYTREGVIAGFINTCLKKAEQWNLWTSEGNKGRRGPDNRF